MAKVSVRQRPLKYICLYMFVKSVTLKRANSFLIWHIRIFLLVVTSFLVFLNLHLNLILEGDFYQK